MSRHAAASRARVQRRVLLQTAGCGLVALAAPLAAVLPAPAPDGAPWPAGDGADVGATLAASMIWAADAAHDIPLSTGPDSHVTPAAQGEGDRHADFHRQFRIARPSGEAMLHLFAYTRYRLYVNGRYVGRGPCRFENSRPAYDSWDVTALLRQGDNRLAVLVHRDAPTGRIMRHAPGFAALLAWTEGGRPRRLVTDGAWRARADRSFGPRPLAWSSIQERIDARLSDDWTAADHDARSWPRAVAVAAADAPLQPRTIPLLRETVVDHTIESDATLPLALADGDSATLTLGRLALAYHRLVFEASADAEIEVRTRDADGVVTGIGIHICRAGRQCWEGGDVFATRTLALRVTGGTVTVREAALIEVLYPYEQLGRFDCDDGVFNRLYAMGARSIQLLSEDSYTDCADRERVEWMDCSPPAFDVARVMMAGCDADGGLVHSDPRLLRELLWRTALTQRPDGMMKAHTCSERWDIHAVMEDRMCPWVGGLLRYHEATGDDAFVRRLWPRLERLVAWFLDRRTPRGLVLAREWEVNDNPLRYQLCEGLGLNALVVRALKDAAFLAGAIGLADRAGSHADAARTLAAAVNAALWDEAAGIYRGALFGPGSERRTQLNAIVFDGPLDADGRFRPTLQGALCALQAELVPADRHDRVVSWVLAHLDEATDVMSHDLLFRVLYALDRPACDAEALDRMRRGWSAMVAWPGGTSWESITVPDASRVHIYGTAPVYFLAAFVLGVRPAPVRERRLLVDPRPGGLMRADGVVETEYGPVPVRWSREGSAFHLAGEIPHGVRATLRLPPPAADAWVVGGPRPIRVRAGQRSSVDQASGSFELAMRPVGNQS